MLKYIRENIEKVKKGLARKNHDVSVIDEIIKIDERRKELIKERDALRHTLKERNSQIVTLKKEGKDTSKEIASLREISQKVKTLEKELDEIEKELKYKILKLPNIPAEKTPEQDTVVREWGKELINKIDVIPHWDIGPALGILDFEKAAKISGSRFVMFKGKGARLERALINFCLEHNIKNGYTEIMPPVLNKPAAPEGAGQLPNLKDEMYYCEKDDLYLAPTAEVPLVNMHREEIIEEKNLPLKYTAYTPCFRREAGSYGKDVRGMIRIHQFDKVEIVRITTSEQSYDALEEMVKEVEDILQLLKLPYRVVALSAKELGFQSSFTYDLEVYSPGVKKYLEVSSVSNCESFQARRMNLKIRKKDGKTEYPHLLNGSAIALPRIFVAILENYQTEDGKIKVPEVLIPYMGGIEIIE